MFKTKFTAGFLRHVMHSYVILDSKLCFRSKLSDNKKKKNTFCIDSFLFKRQKCKRIFHKTIWCQTKPVTNNNRAAKLKFACERYIVNLSAESAITYFTSIPILTPKSTVAPATVIQIAIVRANRFSHMNSWSQMRAPRALHPV